MAAPTIPTSAPEIEELIANLRLYAEGADLCAAAVTAKMYRDSADLLASLNEENEALREALVYIDHLCPADLREQPYDGQLRTRAWKAGDTARSALTASKEKKI